MALKPIKLRLDGEDVHLVPARDVDRWGGYMNGRHGAWELTTAENIGDIRQALMCPPSQDTEGVYTELRKQLEDGSALFFELPPKSVPFDSPPEVDIRDLIPDGRDDRDSKNPDAHGSLHWLEVVCVSAKGESFAGAKARVRLPDGRTEHVTLSGTSSVRFDDLTEGGTALFELSGDAVARGSLRNPEGTRYDLGASIGLSTRRQHVLVVHPNPRAFVSVELFVEDEPVSAGNYTLTTKLGDQGGPLDGKEARADGFALPSSATYSFEQVTLPPRPAKEDVPGKPDAPINPDDSGSVGHDPITHEPKHPPVPEDAVRVTLRLEDGSSLPGSIQLSHAKTDEAEGEEAEFTGIHSTGTLRARSLRIPD
ncbi:MAG: hypothetical protein ACRBN8_46595 [Nannocystales bacterium]